MLLQNSIQRGLDKWGLKFAPSAPESWKCRYSLTVKSLTPRGKFLEWNGENLSSDCDSILYFQIPSLQSSSSPSSSVIMWGSEGGDDGGSGDYEYESDEGSDNETSSVRFSFTNVENNRSEESVIELPGMIMMMIQTRVRETKKGVGEVRDKCRGHKARGTSRL